MELNQLQWDSLHRTEGDNLVVDFDARPRHIAAIPFEVLEDGLATINEEPLASAQQNRSRVERAIVQALEGNDWKESVNIQTGRKLFQLWVTRSHFGKGPNSSG